MSEAHQKIDNPSPAAGDKVFTYSAALAAWVLTSLTQLKGWLLSAIPLAWGSWTPVCTASTNLDANPSGFTSRYVRVGSMVLVFGSATVDPTAAATIVFTFPPPITSAFTSNGQCGGVASGSALTQGRITCDSSTDQLVVTAGASGTTAVSIWFAGAYEVVS